MTGTTAKRKAALGSAAGGTVAVAPQPVLDLGRRLVDGAWIYSDAAVESAKRIWKDHWVFSLEEFDDYLEGDGWDSDIAQRVRAGLLRKRAQALQAQAERNIEAVEAWLNFFTAAMQIHQQREWLLGLARIGNGHKKKQSERARNPRFTIALEDGGTTKEAIVQTALRAAGVNAGTPDVWPHLQSELELLGLSLRETVVDDSFALVGKDAAGKPLKFTFKGVQTMLRELRGDAVNKPKRGRPTK